MPVIVLHINLFPRTFSLAPKPGKRSWERGCLHITPFGAKISVEFVRWHSLFRETHSFLRACLDENCET